MSMLRLILSVAIAVLLATGVFIGIQLSLSKTKDALNLAKGPAGLVEVEGTLKCTVGEREMVAAGVLRNRGLRIEENVSVRVVWRNDSGEMVSSEKFQVLEDGQLLPSAAKSFRIPMTSIAGVTSCEVSVGSSN